VFSWGRGSNVLALFFNAECGVQNAEWFFAAQKNELPMLYFLRSKKPFRILHSAFRIPLTFAFITA